MTGAVIAFVGVLIGIAAGRLNLKLQLKHQAREAWREEVKKTGLMIWEGGFSFGQTELAEADKKRLMAAYGRLTLLLNDQVRAELTALELAEALVHRAHGAKLGSDFKVLDDDFLSIGDGKSISPLLFPLMVQLQRLLYGDLADDRQTLQHLMDWTKDRVQSLRFRR